MYFLPKQRQRGEGGWPLLWLVGIPVCALMLVLFRGCT